MHSMQISSPGRGGEWSIFIVKSKQKKILHLREGGDGRRAREKNLISVRKRHTDSEVKPKLLKKTRREAKSSIRI